MDDQATLALAFKELAALLNKHPELYELQMEIERELEKVGQDPEIRLGLLMSLIHQKLTCELLPYCELLQEKLNDTREILITRRKKLS